VNPGDRKCQCLGVMEPIGVVSTSKGYIIIHKCQKCGMVKRNKSSVNDCFETILSIAKKGESHA